MKSSGKKPKRVHSGVPIDIHASVLATSVNAGIATLAALDPDDPSASMNSRIDSVVEHMLELLAGFNPIAVIEQARLRALPWHSGQPTYQAGVEDGFARVELIALLALKLEPRKGPPSGSPASIIEGCVADAGELLNLGSLLGLVNADSTDPLAEIKATVQATEITMRGSSYSELLQETAESLFGDGNVDSSLRSSLGFGIAEAQEVLAALNKLQTANMNRRREQGFRFAAETNRKRELGIASKEDIADAALKLDRALHPNEVAASVSSADLARASHLPEHVVSSVLEAFSWKPDPAQSASTAVKEFLSGANPFRVSPIVRTTSSRAMLVHPALTQGAIRERLELALHSSPDWEKYQALRGSVLEDRTRRAFDRLVSPTRAWHSILYYVPATDSEEEIGPAAYTKRVEGDHLIILDDVALIVEDKAVALSSRSRSGSGSRLRKDLTGIITKAAEQADRLLRRISLDGGLLIHGEGWVDLSHLREFHTIAVSLDDLGSTSTATAALVQAGVIGTESVPWTVSIHDLDLIAEITDHPAELLLYLRRRRHPLATILFTAPDELDLFLFFLEAGLYVEDNPAEVRAIYPYLNPPSPVEQARWRNQTPGIVTSRTDPLDAWYFETHRPREAGKPAVQNSPPKPRRSPSPIDGLLASIDRINPIGRLSIEATLLSGDKRAQARMARHGRDVVRGSRNGQLARSITIPVHSLHDGGWLLVWATPSGGGDHVAWEHSMRAYARVKGHQLGISRSAVFAFDGGSGEMFAVYYEATPEKLNSDEERRSTLLQPAESSSTTAQMRKSMTGQRDQPRRKGKTRKSKK
ncbi:preprotein translocase subunit SecA [Cryobacterium sp. Hz7]|uniref:preprotein translocase subunit SecA n=1 Tax=Cryobacterium sp. Hz7 TaxID=1259166 RepID=UPI00106BD81E|nr:preprotein translocase subunit SecA [Cryobacterium sp. Hz7]TFB61362.1 preprotein translocase subunit SecA [Cryobacterium sp. Hz7]